MKQALTSLTELVGGILISVGLFQIGSTFGLIGTGVLIVLVSEVVNR
jgi:hypothetical protein